MIEWLNLFFGWLIFHFVLLRWNVEVKAKLLDNPLLTGLMLYY